MKFCTRKPQKDQLPTQVSSEDEHKYCIDLSFQNLQELPLRWNYKILIPMEHLKSQQKNSKEIEILGGPKDHLRTKWVEFEILGKDT